MLGMCGIRIMSENQLLNGYANGITPNGSRLCAGGDYSTEAKLKNDCSNYHKCFIVVVQPHLHKTDVMHSAFSVN